MKLSKLLLGLLVSCAALAVNAQTVIKFSHVVAADTPKGKASEFFAKRAAELTGGKVKVEVYPNSTLYKDKEEMEALQIGAVQMLAPSLAKFGPLGVREFELFDLPFIFDNETELHKVTTGPVGKMLPERFSVLGPTCARTAPWRTTMRWPGGTFSHAGFTSLSPVSSRGADETSTPLRLLTPRRARSTSRSSSPNESSP